MLDTVLNLTASLLFGLTVALLLSDYLLKPIRRTSAGIGRDLLLGGLASGAALLAMAGAFGFNGLQLLLILVIPSLCVSAAGVGWYGQIQDEKTSWLAIAALVGLSTAAPMMFVDPDELNLILVFGTRDIPYWAFTAAVISMIIGLTFSSAFLLYRRFLSGLKPLKPLAAVLSLSWVVGIVIFLGTGQPGLHGDQLFVILNDQVNLDEFAGQVDINERQGLIYRALVDQAKESQAEIQQVLERVGIDYTSYYLVNALAVNGGQLLKFWLELRPEVDRVLENPILRPLPSNADSSEGGANAPLRPTWNLTQIGADRVWNELGVTGEGIIVGHADSGVQWDHPELIDSYRGVTEGQDYNWYDPWFETISPTDASGHGTHTLGTLVGRTTGLAPGAQWFGCANLVRGLGNPTLYLDCLQFLFAPYPGGGDPFLEGDPERAAHIVSNSWLCPEIEGCDQYTLVEAANAMRTAGIFMVVSAGNEGPWCSSIESPMATFEEVYSVGAIDQRGELAIFSSLGPVTSDGSGRTKPDLVAPGDGILSAFPGSSYEVQSGTSMAGPHVAGVVALMWSANPSLIGDIQQTERILAETATPFRGALPACAGDGSLPNNAVGYGVVNAYEAVRASIALR
jgi:subtilisin family serine protease